MAAKNPDTDRKQALKDIYRPNRYALDDRFVLRDGKTHPFAVICPGGAYAVVCSYIEGTPIARRLNERGISAFIVYYRVRGKRAYPSAARSFRASGTASDPAQARPLRAGSTKLWISGLNKEATASRRNDGMMLFWAIDVGASSGRHIEGWSTQSWNEKKEAVS